MKTIVIMLLAALSWGSLSAQEKSENEIILTYLELKNALVKGDASEAASKALHLKTGLNLNKKSFSDKEFKDIQLSAHKISETSDLEKQRISFAILSVGLWPAIKRMEAVELPLYYSYCPMKKAYWISEEQSIKNPFYGKQMLTCVKIEEKLGQLKP